MAVFKQDRQDRDYYALQELLKPKEEAEKSSGIGTKPDNQEQDDEGLFSSFFGGLFDRSRQQAQELSVLAEEEAIRSALEIRLMRQAAGITSSKAPTGQLSDTARDAMFSSSDMRGTDLTMMDNAREAQEVFQPMITPVSRGEQPERADSPAPVDAPSIDTRSNEMLDKPKGIMSKDIEDVLKTVLDSDANDSTDSADGGAAPSDGKEIETGEALTDDVDASISEVTTTLPVYSATTNSVYTDFYENNEEGDEAHIGVDSHNLTLAAGIVADGGVTYNGKEVKAGKNTVKASEFDASKVDMSKAYKKVGGKNYKREDYTSDEDWSKAVIEAFKDVVKGRAGDSWDELTDNTKQAVTKLAWNNGEGWANYDTSQSLYKELAKETKDKTIIADGILNYSTVVGGGANIGVAKARANAWNKMSYAHGFAEINKITADNTGAKTKFNYYDKEGNLVHTETTNRAPSKYSSTTTEVEKDAAGEW